MFLDVLNIIDDLLDGSLVTKVWYKHFFVKNMPKSDPEEIWILYYILNMIHEERHWSGALCLYHFLRVLWPPFFFLQLLWSLEIVLKANGMVIAALKNFVRPMEAKCLKKSLSRLRLQILKCFEFFEDSWKTALVRGFVSRSLSTRPMTTILFSTPFVKSRDCFESKRHGHSCSEKFCEAFGSQKL